MYSALVLATELIEVLLVLYTVLPSSSTTIHHLPIKPRNLNFSVFIHDLLKDSIRYEECDKDERTNVIKTIIVDMNVKSKNVILLRKTIVVAGHM